MIANAPKPKTAMKAMRAKCLDCCDGNTKAVQWCTCHGQDGTWCPLWPYRFGVRPGTARAKYGDGLMRPELMPANSVNLDDLRQGPPDDPVAELPIFEHRTPRKAIEGHCRECAGDAPAARDCEMPDCPVFHFRPGHAPKRQLSAAELEARRRNLAVAHVARESAAEGDCAA